MTSGISFPRICRRVLSALIVALVVGEAGSSAAAQQFVYVANRLTNGVSA